MASNYEDVIDQLRSAGLLVESLTTGRVVRCKVEGDREKRGWYALHELVTDSGDVLLVGTFGVWHGTDNGAQKVDLHKSTISAEQRESMRKRLAEDRRRADRIRKSEGDRAAARAAKLWSKLSPTGDCEYLARKGVGAHGLRFSPQTGAVAVPMLDVAGRIHGLQVIRSAADAKAKRRLQKEYWPTGLIKKARFHLVGLPTTILLIVEGYATGASLYEATGLPVAVAFDAGNLAPVAAELHRRYKSVRILVCADDDSFSDGNPGVAAASAAALEVGGAWVRPVFADEDARRQAFEKQRTKLTDFNDLHAIEGLHVVRAQIEAKLTELKWRSFGARKARNEAEWGEGPRPLRKIETLDELLARYALVYAQGGMVFDHDEHVLMSLSDMRDACIKRELHRAWAEHPEAQIVRISEVGFDPGGADPEVRCNLWAGWPTQPKAGKCDKLLELLWYMTEKEPQREQLYRWVLNWIAYPIQHPGAKMKTTLVIHGPQGTGKNLFFEALMRIYGPYGRVIDQSAIEDKFNDWASRKLFLIADEVVARSDLFHIKNKLKGFITGEWVRINPKNLAAYDERNHVNLVFLSNEAQPVVLETDDRRHAIIWTPERLGPDFYTDLVAEVDQGGGAALHHFLLTTDLGDFGTATLPPMTDAKRELVDLSLDSTSRFYHALEDGELQVTTLAPALSQDVYDLYRAYCTKTGLRSAPLPRLLNSLNRRHGVASKRKRYLLEGDMKGPHAVVMLGWMLPPEDRPEVQWLGDSILAFRNAAKDYRGQVPYG